MTSAYADILQRIEAALAAARIVFSRFTPGAIEAEFKAGHDPVTEADRGLDAVLRSNLLRDGEGWLSEESVDDLARLDRQRVWIVDPLDGTREFVKGIPEFCVSIGFVENGNPVAGGIYNPATDETFIGSIDSGVRYNRKLALSSDRRSLQGALTLASRSEVKRGEWKAFENGPLQIRAMGSVAYKLGAGVGGSGRRHLHADAEERMGCGRGRCPGNQFRRLCNHAGKHQVPSQQQEPVDSGLDCRRASPAVRATVSAGATSSPATLPAR